MSGDGASGASRTLDLFAGPGGWDTGLVPLHIRPLGIEWDTRACATATAFGHERMQADIAGLDPHEIGGSDVEGLIASPPCQGFSMAGKGAGRKDSERIIRAVGDFAAGRDPRDDLATEVHDPRSVLALEPLRWTLDLEPEWTTWEQVPAVLPLWEACAEALRADGYSVWTGNVQAEQYGVPQTRQRAILIASRNREVGRPTPTHSRFHPRTPERVDAALRWVSIAEAFAEAGLPLPGDVIVSNYGTGGDPAARGLRYADDPAATVTSKVGRNKWRFAGAGATSEVTAGQIPRGLDDPAHTITGKGTAAWVYRASNQEHAARRPLTTTPAPTVMFGGRSNKVEWMPADLAGDIKASGQRVSVTEAAVLQSFPADYPWQGTSTAQYRQVGDAVPPGLALHVVAEATGVPVPNVAEVAA